MPTWLTIVLALGGSALISGVIGYLVKRAFDKYFTNKEVEDQRKKEQECELLQYREEKLHADRKADIREAISTEIQPLSDKLDAMSGKLDANSTGTITLLRDRMKCSLNYCEKQGYATSTDKANGNELYNSYKALGGNHFREYVDQGKAAMEALPTEKIKKTSAKSKGE